MYIHVFVYMCVPYLNSNHGSKIGASPVTRRATTSMSHRRPGTIRQRPHCVRRRQVTDGVATQARNRTVPLGVYRRLVGWLYVPYVRTNVITDEDPFVNSKLVTD